MKPSSAILLFFFPVPPFFYLCLPATFFIKMLLASLCYKRWAYTEHNIMAIFMGAKDLLDYARILPTKMLPALNSMCILSPTKEVLGRESP
jgi:hypothetical protein